MKTAKFVTALFFLSLSLSVLSQESDQKTHKYVVVTTTKEADGKKVTRRIEVEGTDPVALEREIEAQLEAQGIDYDVEMLDKEGERHLQIKTNGKTIEHQELKMTVTTDDDDMDGEVLMEKEVENANGKEEVRVRKMIIPRGKGGFLGVVPRLMTDESNGAVVTEVVSNSPAAQAGLQATDRITKIDETPITNAEELLKTIAAYAPGSNVTINYLRGNQSMTTQAALVARGSKAVTSEVREKTLRREVRQLEFDGNQTQTIKLEDGSTIQYQPSESARKSEGKTTIKVEIIQE